MSPSGQRRSTQNRVRKVRGFKSLHPHILFSLDKFCYYFHILREYLIFFCLVCLVDISKNGNVIEEFKLKLTSYEKFPFLIKDHARLRAKQRKLSIDEILENIVSNKNLLNVEKQDISKYKLIFQKKGAQKQIYIVELKPNHIEVITVWKELSKFQKEVDKKWKKN